MPRKIMKVAMIAAAGAAIWFGSSSLITKADEANSKVGSVDDPLVTKSYLDQTLANQIKQEIQKQLGNSYVGTPGNSGNTDSSNQSDSSGSANINVVQLQAGQTLQAGAGAELIVRSGKVLAYSSDENGIPDVTSGKDIPAGTAIELNHLLIFPRDGRGIKPDPKNKAEIFVMVRGGYSIINTDGTKVSP